jgi:hypothetical protein
MGQHARIVLGKATRGFRLVLVKWIPLGFARAALARSRSWHWAGRLGETRWAPAPRARRPRGLPACRSRCGSDSPPPWPPQRKQKAMTRAWTESAQACHRSPWGFVGGVATELVGGSNGLQSASEKSTSSQVLNYGHYSIVVAQMPASIPGDWRAEICGIYPPAARTGQAARHWWGR